MAQTESKCKDFIETLTNKCWKRKAFPIDAKRSEEKFIVDGYNSEHNAVWEFDDPMHYKNSEKIDKDERRKKYFDSQEIKLVVIPYYCAFSKTIACELLPPLFHSQKDFKKAMNENYDNAVKKIYNTPNPNPGWYGTQHRIQYFLEKGKERFLKEFNRLPEEAQHQIVFSLLMDGVGVSLFTRKERKEDFSKKDVTDIGSPATKKIFNIVLNTLLNKNFRSFTPRF